MESKIAQYYDGANVKTARVFMAHIHTLRSPHLTHSLSIPSALSASTEVCNRLHVPTKTLGLLLNAFFFLFFIPFFLSPSLSLSLRSLRAEKIAQGRTYAVKGS